MSDWKKCSDELPPMMVPVLVAWDGSTKCRWTGAHYSAVIRDESDLEDRKWDWFEYEADCSCDWDDDQQPTHWMPWPEIKP